MTHRQLPVDFAAVSVQHSEVEGTEVLIETVTQTHTHTHSLHDDEAAPGS